MPVLSFPIFPLEKYPQLFEFLQISNREQLALLSPHIKEEYLFIDERESSTQTVPTVVLAFFYGTPESFQALKPTPENITTVACLAVACTKIELLKTLDLAIVDRGFLLDAALVLLNGDNAKTPDEADHADFEPIYSEDTLNTISYLLSLPTIREFFKEEVGKRSYGTREDKDRLSLLICRNFDFFMLTHESLYIHWFALIRLLKYSPAKSQIIAVYNEEGNITLSARDFTRILSWGSDKGKDVLEHYIPADKPLVLDYTTIAELCERPSSALGALESLLFREPPTLRNEVILKFRRNQIQAIYSAWLEGTPAFPHRMHLIVDGIDLAKNVAQIKAFNVRTTEVNKDYLKTLGFDPTLCDTIASHRSFEDLRYVLDRMAFVFCFGNTDEERIMMLKMLWKDIAFNHDQFLSYSHLSSTDLIATLNIPEDVGMSRLRVVAEKSDSLFRRDVIALIATFFYQANKVIQLNPKVEIVSAPSGTTYRESSPTFFQEQSLSRVSEQAQRVNRCAIL